MAVLKSYKCEEHGYFDAWEQACEHCDKVPEQVFLKPFSIKSDRTKKADRTLKGLAKDFGMTNLKSTREGESQTGYHTRNNKPMSRQEQEFANQPPKGYEAANNGGVNWGGAAGMSMPSVLAGTAVKSVYGEPTGFNPRNVEGLTGPKPNMIMRDHENLSLKDSK